MPASTALSRVKTDFFAILAPGFFVLGVIVSVFLAFTHKELQTSVMNRFSAFSKTIKEDWVLAIVLIIIAYLLGNLIRALRVTLADNFSKIFTKIFLRFTKNENNKLLYGDSFPYPGVLKRIEQNLKNSNLTKNIELKEEDYSYDAWNFWKITVCLELPDAFNYIESLESRVRLFAGMFWAGFSGVIVSILIFAKCICNNVVWETWLVFDIYMFVISTVLFFVFGIGLRRVRGQEARSVFMAYLALQNKKKEEEK